MFASTAKAFNLSRLSKIRASLEMVARIKRTNLLRIARQKSFTGLDTV
jgi:hypothetical protein